MNNIDYDKIYLKNIIKVKLNWVKFLSSFKEAKISIFDLSLKIKEIENELLNEEICVEEIDNAIIIKLIEKGLSNEQKYYPVNNRAIDNIIVANYLRNVLFNIRDLTDNEWIINAITNILSKPIETNIMYHTLENVMELFTDEISIGYNSKAIIEEQIYLYLSVFSYIIYILKNNQIDVEELEILVKKIMYDYHDNFQINNYDNIILLCKCLSDRLITINKSKRLNLK